MIHAKSISPISRDFWKIRRLYHTAFPPVERFPFPYLFLKSLSKSIDFLALYDDDKLLGLFYITRAGETSIVIFFAILEELRNQKYGSQCLKWLLTNARSKNITLILECQDPAAENWKIRMRRRAFYFRNGFRETGYVHKVPNTTQPYEIIATTDSFNSSEYLEAVRKLYPKFFRVEVERCHPGGSQSCPSRVN